MTSRLLAKKMLTKNLRGVIFTPHPTGIGLIHKKWLSKQRGQKIDIQKLLTLLLLL